MLAPYFADDSTWERFLSIAESWIGTPYKHMTMVKGRGADCTLFIGACWLEMGILTAVTYDYYPKDWHLHTDDEYVLAGLYRHFRDHIAEGFALRHCEPTEPELRGDLLTFAMTQRNVSNHSAIYLGPYRGQGAHILHSINGRGVKPFPYEGLFSRKRKHIFRIMRWVSE